MARLALLRAFASVLHNDSEAARQAIAAFEPADLKLIDVDSTMIYEILHASIERWLNQ